MYTMISKDAESFQTPSNFYSTSSTASCEPNQALLSYNELGQSQESHGSCAENIPQSEYFTKLVPKFPFLKRLTSRQIPVGSLQYLVSFRITHPITSQKLFQSNQKLMETDQVIYFNVAQNLNDFYATNHIVLSTKEFNCYLAASPLGFKIERSTALHFRVDLCEEPEGICYVLVEDQKMVFVAEFQLIDDLQLRAQIINNMNYKMSYSWQQESFVKLNNYFIEFKSLDSLPTCALSIAETRQTVTSQEISKNQLEEKQKKSSPPTTYSPIKFYEQLEEPEDDYDPQFINNIKTQAGSKQFQKKAKNLTPLQIESIINQILPRIEEITLNGYANYMLQSLHEVCSYEQRMKIIMSLGEKFSSLVCQQQGTFVFQHLLTKLEKPDQFEAICNFVLPEFQTIALSTYGHHFLRKMFELMPPYLVYMFVPAVQLYFIEMSTSQHAVFIVRSMVKILKRLEDQFCNYSEPLERLLQNLSTNIKLFVTHEYGNYLVQEVYQTIELQRLRKITNYIITFFTDISCGKFSSNIILNCLKKIWPFHPELLKSIQQRLDRKDMKMMFRNKEGNKVLLELMDLHQVPVLVNKISQMVRSEESIKFNSKKWVLVTGTARTGEVGTKYTSFSEAHSFLKKKHEV